MRALVQIAHAIRRLILSWMRIRTRGVKVMLFNDAGELLLIRNSYGNKRVFLLPGGGVGRGETPEAAVVREVREELNLEIVDLNFVATYESSAEGKRDNIHLFSATPRGLLEADSVELEEARFFPLDALPQNLSPATFRRISEVRGERPINGRW